MPTILELADAGIDLGRDDADAVLEAAVDRLEARGDGVGLAVVAELGRFEVDLSCGLGAGLRRGRGLLRGKRQRHSHRQRQGQPAGGCLVRHNTVRVGARASGMG